LASNEELQAALLEDKSSLIMETEMAIKQECLARLEPGRTLFLFVFYFVVKPELLPITILVIKVDQKILFYPWLEIPIRCLVTV
jgi:hypothetical protein